MVAVMLVIFIVFGLRRIPDTAQHEARRLINITSLQPVSQTVVPRKNGLNTVLIFFRNPNLANTDRLIFSLSQKTGEEIRRIDLSGRNIGDGVTVRFQFPPVVDSSGRTYILALQAPDTPPSSPNPLSIGTSVEDAYPAGRLTSPAGETGDLSFQLFYSPLDKRELTTELGLLFWSRLVSLRLLLIFALAFLFSVRFLQFCIPQTPGDR